MKSGGGGGAASGATRGAGRGCGRAEASRSSAASCARCRALSMKTRRLARASAGDNHLGGEDFVQLLADQFLAERDLDPRALDAKTRKAS